MTGKQATQSGQCLQALIIFISEHTAEKLISTCCMAITVLQQLQCLVIGRGFHTPAEGHQRRVAAALSEPTRTGITHTQQQIEQGVTKLFQHQDGGMPLLYMDDLMGQYHGQTILAVYAAQ